MKKLKTLTIIFLLFGFVIINPSFWFLSGLYPYFSLTVIILMIFIGLMFMIIGSYLLIDITLYKSPPNTPRIKPQPKEELSIELFDELLEQEDD